jgi:hypothetical protein
MLLQVEVTIVTVKANLLATEIVIIQEEIQLEAEEHNFTLTIK